MSLEYEPTSEPLHISVKYLLGGAVVRPERGGGRVKGFEVAAALRGVAAAWSHGRRVAHADRVCVTEREREEIGKEREREREGPVQLTCSSVQETEMDRTR